MNLAIFDIDGTLTQTSQVDGECFVRALAETLGISGVETDWTRYTHSTDSGLACEICRGCLGRDPGKADLARFKARFLELLAEAAERTPGAFLPNPGAVEALERLRVEPGWAVAIATGCYRQSALLKLQRAGLDSAEVPLAGSDDLLAREEILEAAREAAAARQGTGGFERVVYVGDGLWDSRACARIGLPFVGIGSGARAEALRRAGASPVLPGLADYGRLLRGLAEATVPLSL
jgi:phosphoglycolate phosphatase-like HAD superfamily hydrolase